MLVSALQADRFSAPAELGRPVAKLTVLSMRLVSAEGTNCWCKVGGELHRLTAEAVRCAAATVRPVVTTAEAESVGSILSTDGARKSLLFWLVVCLGGALAVELLPAAGVTLTGAAVGGVEAPAADLLRKSAGARERDEDDARTVVVVSAAGAAAAGASVCDLVALAAVHVAVCWDLALVNR